jgi:hypothetical protein
MSCWRRMAFLLDSMRHSLADSRAVVSAKSLDTVNFSLRGRRRPSAGLCGWPRRCPPGVMRSMGNRLEPETAGFWSPETDDGENQDHGCGDEDEDPGHAVVCQ